MKIFLLFSLALIIVLAVFVFMNRAPVASRPVSEPAQAAPVDPYVAEQRVTEMRQHYDLLKQARGELRRQLGQLKAELWGVKLPPVRAREMSHAMAEAHAVLKNPPMLGAFHDLAAIEREYQRVNYSLAAIAGIRQSLQGTQIK